VQPEGQKSQDRGWGQKEKGSNSTARCEVPRGKARRASIPRTIDDGALNEDPPRPRCRGRCSACAVTWSIGVSPSIKFKQLNSAA
jgi:hypothetical protein